MEIKYCSDNEIKNNPNNIVLDNDISTQGIEDLNHITTEILNFLEFTDTQEMIELEKANKEKYENELEKKFKSFTTKYFSMYKMLLERQTRTENLKKLLDLFEILKKVKIGEKNQETELEKFEQSLAEQYIYPKFGGKKEFEEKLKKHKNKK